MRLRKRFIFAGCWLLCCVAHAASPPSIPDLGALPSGKGWKGDIAAFQLTQRNGSPAVACSSSGQHVAWIDAFDFQEGSIEFDAKGKTDPQSSFIGIAFRVRDEAVFDAVYLRPFNFRADDPQRRSHAIQYVSEPQWPWQRLRAERQGQFEGAIASAPSGDSWFHVRLTVRDHKVSAWVDNVVQPVLTVEELGHRAGGSVGILCIGYGVLANLSITPER